MGRRLWIAVAAALLLITAVPQPAQAAAAQVWWPCKHHVSVGYNGFNPNIAYGQVIRQNCYSYGVALTYSFFGGVYQWGGGCYTYPGSVRLETAYGNPIQATSLTGGWYEQNCWAAYSLPY